MEGSGSCEDSDEVGDKGCEDGKDETGAAEIKGIVCSVERPNVEGK